MKFNPIHAMNLLLQTMIKDKPSLVLQNPSNGQQLVLASKSLPTQEANFKKYFKLLNPRSEKNKSAAHLHQLSCAQQL